MRMIELNVYRGVGYILDCTFHVFRVSLKGSCNANRNVESNSHFCSTFIIYRLLTIDIEESIVNNFFFNFEGIYVHSITFVILLRYYLLSMLFLFLHKIFVRVRSCIIFIKRIKLERIRGGKKFEKEKERKRDRILR